MVPNKMFFTRGVGIHRERLDSFEAALRDRRAEADEFFARVIQHELDHLDGVLLLDRLGEDQRKDAKRAVRELQMRFSEPAEACLTPEPRSRTSFFRLR